MGDNEASGWGSKVGKDPDCPDNDDGYEHGEDSKAVRLSLMEEVLLLGIKDREVCKAFVFQNPHREFCCLLFF